MDDAKLYKKLKCRRINRRSQREGDLDWRKIIPTETERLQEKAMNTNSSVVPTRRKAVPLDIVGENV